MSGVPDEPLRHRIAVLEAEILRQENRLAALDGFFLCRKPRLLLRRNKGGGWHVQLEKARGEVEGYLGRDHCWHMGVGVSTAANMDRYTFRDPIDALLSYQISGGLP